MLLYLAFPAMAQDSDRFQLKPMVFESDEDYPEPEVLLSAEFDSRFLPMAQAGRSSVMGVYWLKMDFQNHLHKLAAFDHWVVNVGSAEKSTLFKVQDGKITRYEYGYFLNDRGHKHASVDYDAPFQASELINGRYLLIKYQRHSITTDLTKLKAIVQTVERAESRLPRIEFLLLQNRTSVFIFSGIALIVLLFALSAYITQKRKEYLYYSFYLTALIIYFGRTSLGFHDWIFNPWPMLEYLTHMELQVLINLSYVLFARHFLITERDYPKLDLFIKWISRALMAFIIIDIGLILIEQYGIHVTAMTVQRYFMASFGLLGSIYLIVKRKSPLVYFIVFGSLSYTAGALATLFTSENDYMIIGSSIEIFVFTLGLGYKSLSLIAQNAAIQQNVLQLEMSALRAQMNPHFIFNSLGSIKNLVRKDHKTEALQYLNTFSKLLREILNSSKQGSVTLEEEASLLRNYIELEALRFNGRFHYEVTISPELDSHNLEIPVLLVQPHVENAILHGLLPKEGEARLKVAFEDEDAYIHCTIEDNGIGRAKAAENKGLGGEQHRSVGQSIVADRLKNLNGQEAGTALVQIDDILGSSGEAAGTRVTVKIPKDD